ncbi:MULTISPECIES: hypothetical protein [Sorangium]|uniref:hypothetical protein n=1 Tax=Sorangium TaxID=39643 RepID=UPI003D9C5F7D
MQKHRISDETVAGHVSADNLSPAGIDVHITGEAAVVLVLALAALIGGTRRGPTGRRRARPSRKPEGRLRIAT